MKAKQIIVHVIKKGVTKPWFFSLKKIQRAHNGARRLSDMFAQQAGVAMSLEELTALEVDLPAAIKSLTEKAEKARRFLGIHKCQPCIKGYCETKGRITPKVCEEPRWCGMSWHHVDADIKMMYAKRLILKARLRKLKQRFQDHVQPKLDLERQWADTAERTRLLITS
jgi:hypothetical protein